MKRVLISLFALAGTMYACTSPVEDVDVGLKTALATSIELRFKPQSGQLPEALKVRIVGPDADKVVTILNTKNFRVDQDGVLKLSTDASVVPTSEQPVHFTIVATADNFLEVVQPVTLTDNNQRLTSLTMFSKQSSTPIVQTTAQSNSSGSLTNTVRLQTTGTLATQATVTIPQGTILKDATDQPVDGNLLVRMQPVVVNSAMDLPKGGVITNAMGEAVGSQQLSAVAGVVTLEIHNNDYKTVKTFSTPIHMAFVVNQQTINPQTKERIKHGDVIPMFSYDAATDRWQQEATGRIQKNYQTGQLECLAELPHLSTWTAAYAKPTCSEGVTFKVKSNFTNYDIPFYCQVVYVDKNGRDGSVASSFYRELIDGSEIEVTNLNQDESVRLKVYENPADLSKFVASPTVKSCSKGQTNLDVRSLKIPSSATPMTFTIKFPCKNVDEKALPESVVAQFRESGTATWQNLVTLNRKDIKKDLLQGATYKVAYGKRYDLRVKVLGFNFEQSNLLLDKNDWLVPIRGKEFCKK